MKRSFFLFALLAIASSVFSQTAIDKPAATVKLLRQEVISVRQLKAEIEKIETAVKQKLTAEQRKDYLDSKIDTILFTQYCERERIIVPDADVNAALNQVRTSLGPGADDTKLEAFFRSQGVFIDPKTYIRQQLLFQSFLKAKKSEEIKGLQPPSAEEVLKAYELLKANLIRPDTVRLSVIYVDLRTLSAEDKRKMAETMRQVAGQVKASPGRFDELMIRASDPGTGYRATPSVYVERTPQFQNLYGDLFMERVFALKAGEISELIENEAGLQIVRANEILPQKQLGLSDPVPGQQSATVQDLIRQNLMQERQARFLSGVKDELIAQLRKEATIKVYEENLAF